MAYAAVISLKQTINGLLNPYRNFHTNSSTPEILKFAYSLTTSLQKTLDKLNDSSRSRSKSSYERLEALDGQIRDAVRKLEDVLEFHELKSQDELVGEEIASFAEAVKTMEICYVHELSRDNVNDEDDRGGDDAAVITDFGVEMVGNSRLFSTIRDLLLRRMRPDDTCFFSFLGENGSGRTAAAKTIFEDLSKDSDLSFDCYAWVTTGHDQLKEVLISVIAQVAGTGHCEVVDEKQICSYLYKILENRRFMIVLDDVWDVKVVDSLKSLLPDQSNGSLVFVTTSLVQVAETAHSGHSFVLPSNYFKEIVWQILRFWVFGDESISEELKEDVNKIIDSFRSLFVLAAKSLLPVLKSGMTLEQWSKIAAANEEDPDFVLEDEISEISKIKTEMQTNNWAVDGQRVEVIVELVSRWVNFSRQIETIKAELHPKRFFAKMQIISLLGMAGIGKSNLVRKIFNDKSVFKHYDYHVWITLGPKYEKEEILTDVLAQIFPFMDKLHLKEDGEFVSELCLHLSSKRCLIVLDDLWSKEPLHHLKQLFNAIKGTILVTTRLAKVAQFEEGDSHFKMKLLDKEESWHLFCQKVFVGGLCPPELEKAGRKIVEKCDSLPLLILTVAVQLLKFEISEEFWNKVAFGKQKAVFMNAHRQISEALLPSYRILPRYLRPCFLYMGVFREKCKVTISEVTNLWISEGFLEPRIPYMNEDYVAECLSRLVDDSLIMVQLKISNDEIKTCRFHSIFWHLSNGQAIKSKFFYALDNYEDCMIESPKSQHRLCIRNNILLGFAEVQKSVASMTNTRSLMCVGPLHPYQVPLNFDLRLLRVMNAVTIRLYEFPIEVVRLVHLRYLSLTCNGMLPTSISNLQKLRCLIVKRYMNTKSSGHTLLLPEEIWDMKELKHLEVMGGCLADHKHGTGFLNITTLLDVSAQCCRKEVLRWTPYIQRLGIRIELEPNDDGNHFQHLNYIYGLCGLQSLKCVVVNPQIRPGVVPPIFAFPSSIKKLSLSGLGYPWKYMTRIGNLENLEVLKLKNYAFQGPTLEMDFKSQFKKLTFLLLEDTNLVQWKMNWSIGMSIERLCIRHCYKLKDLPHFFPVYGYTKIEVVDCNPLTVAWVEKLDIPVIDQPKVRLSWTANPSGNDAEDVEE